MTLRRVALIAVFLFQATEFANSFASPQAFSSAVCQSALSGIDEPILRRSGQKRALSFLSMSREDESEWYVAPPESQNSPPTPKLPIGTKPKISEIRSDVDLQEFLAEDDRLCLVKFYASWCKSCQKFNIHHDKLAKEKSDWVDSSTGKLVKENEMRMASIEYSKCQSLCKSLGVEKLPTVFLYSKGRKLTELSVGASKFGKVRDAIAQYSSFSPMDIDFATTIQEGGEMIKANVLTTTATAQAESSDVVEERRAKIEALLTTSAAKASSSRKKWWSHQKK
eukprot:CAMPEP_0172442064 /NCGR_PEP_ID=MMETSP1065-20121228/2543_1 /TAXON_ID=265537 /ORGANISM="Amphiprora paludosa, Strain CCMP125" /LENGTH=280 /DNA_ID=CAMNT_0013191751 /DNA_START=76 /DNA_END=918 /DNA_ORIENTATION=+